MIELVLFRWADRMLGVLLILLAAADMCSLVSGSIPPSAGLSDISLTPTPTSLGLLALLAPLPPSL